MPGYAMKMPFVKKAYTRYVTGKGKKHFLPNPAYFASARNARKNSRMSAVSTYIGKQGGGGPADELRFGLFRMAVNGCEVIAAYNLLKYLGHFRDIRQIAADFERSGAVLLGGFGVRPGSIRSYLERSLFSEVRLVRTTDADEMDRVFAGHRAAIISFWNGPKKWTIHTVMLCRLPNGRVRLFNRFIDRVTADYDSLRAFADDPKDPVVPLSLIVPEGPLNLI